MRLLSPVSGQVIPRSLQSKRKQFSLAVYSCLLSCDVEEIRNFSPIQFRCQYFGATLTFRSPRSNVRYVHQCKHVFMWLFALLSQTSAWCIYYFPVCGPCSYYGINMPQKWKLFDPELDGSCLKSCAYGTRSHTHFRGKERQSCFVYSEVKGKAIPLQAWTGPEGSWKLWLPDFKTIGTWRW
jgi:hypothetical protein